jgi:peptidoglycan/LPS O-acetylase OafA/YrhL
MRNREIDGLKFLCFFIIYTTHFISQFDTSLLALWTELPSSLFLRGITGKFAVAIFGILLGYLAYMQGQKRKRSILHYTVKRYIYFFICAILVNTSFYALGRLNFLTEQYSLADVLRASLLLDSSVFPAFWCMQAFLVSSVISYMFGYYSMGLTGALMVVAFLLPIGKIWTGVCLLGMVIAILSRDENCQKLFGNKILQWLLLVAAFIAIQREESQLTYLLDGIFGCVMLILITYNNGFKKLFSLRPVSSLGTTSMMLYLVHEPVYLSLGSYLFKLIGLGADNFLINFVVWFICLVVIILISFPLNKLVNWLINIIDAKLLQKLEKLSLFTVFD